MAIDLVIGNKYRVKFHKKAAALNYYWLDQAEQRALEVNIVTFKGHCSPVKTADCEVTYPGLLEPLIIHREDFLPEEINWQERCLEAESKLQQIRKILKD